MNLEERYADAEDRANEIVDLLCRGLALSGPRPSSGPGTVPDFGTSRFSELAMYLAHTAAEAELLNAALSGGEEV